MRSPVIFCKKKIFLDERTIIIYNIYGRICGRREYMAVLDDFEPLEYYTKHLKQEFRQSAADYFDGLVKRSGVDEKLNARTVQKYNAAYAVAEKERGKLGAAKAVRGLTIALIVMALIAALVMIICYACGVTSAIGVLIGGIACFVVGIALIAVLCTAVKNYVGRRQKNYDAAAEKADRIKNEAFDQLRPLHALFSWDATRELIQHAMPFMTFDKRLERERLEMLQNKYGYDAGSDDADVSTVFLLSGMAEGNPFVFQRKLRHAIISATYTGTLTIHWTTTHRDSEGHTVTEHHSQTLVATIQKPAPQYTYETRLYYGNEAAPDLSFSRQPKNVHEYSEEELEKMVKKGEKQLAKKARKATQSGGNFTELGNSEFDVLFGATDRDNEVQFRLMFTPLAQTNMLDLMKSDDGYGDDFAFYKHKMLNCICSRHAQAWDTNTNPSRYISHDLAASRQEFINFNCAYLKSVYFDFAPLFSVPIYRTTKPHEYIYKDIYAMRDDVANYTRCEAETVANAIGEARFAPAGSSTRCILKTQFLRANGRTDNYRITSLSYHTEPRVEYVSMIGGDGLMHAVPVHWTEYIPVSRTDEMAVRETTDGRNDFERRLSLNSFATFVRSLSPDGATGYSDWLVGVPTGGSPFADVDDEQFANALSVNTAAAATGVLAGIAAIEAAADLADDEDAKRAAAEKEKADGGDAGGSDGDKK